MKIIPERGLGLDEVCLIADRPSIVESRDNVKVDMSRIIMAPMTANQHLDFVLETVNLGMSIVVHRLNTPEEQKALINYALNNRKKNSRVWMSVGLKDWEERLKLNENKLFNDTLGICVDVANSFSLQVQEVLNLICQKYPHVKNTNKLMVGNVDSREGFEFSQLYAGIIRVNIGSGVACSTAISTGFTQPSFSLLKELYELPTRNADIIYDGGLNTPGDFCKVFLGGADWAMTGGFFSKSEETHSDIYYGGASETAKKITGSRADYVEGKEMKVIDKVPMKQLYDKLHDGLASAVSYAGYSSLGQAVGRGTFRIVKG